MTAKRPEASRRHQREALGLYVAGAVRALEILGRRCPAVAELAAAEAAVWRAAVTGEA